MIINFPKEIPSQTLVDITLGIHKKGRPSAANQLKMHECLKYYFKKGMTAR